MLQTALMVLLLAAQSSNSPVRPAPFPAPRPLQTPAPLAPADAPGQVELPSVAFMPDTMRYYPPASMANGEQGLTRLRCVLDVTGSLIDCALEQSSGYPALDAAAFQLAAAARYRPMRVGGEAVKSRVVLPVRWVIAG
ncbi:MAG TPA: TonB family protein [Sphingomonas sp.]|jgi:protein TonB|nr:TonB family protein [Sphingomonas sp.]